MDSPALAKLAYFWVQYRWLKSSVNRLLPCVNLNCPSIRCYSAAPSNLYSGTIAITNTVPTINQTAFTVPIGQTTIITTNSFVTDADGDPIIVTVRTRGPTARLGCGPLTTLVAGGIAVTPSSSGGACPERFNISDTIASREISLTFTSPAAQTISFTSAAPTSAQAGGANYTADATSTGCTLAGSTVAFTGAGTCRINANQAGNGSFQVAPQVQQSFAVAAAPALPGFSIGSITLPATIAGLNTATRVSFPQVFASTTVVIVQGDNSNADPQAICIANVSNTGFDALAVEAPGCVGCTGAAGAE